MNEPLIMAWTVMPFRVVAKAWTDSTFKTALLSTPNDVLRVALWELPWGSNFIVTEESGNQRYLPLPQKPNALLTWTQDQVLSVLIRETFGDDKLQYYLPARVINAAFTDPIFKASLLSNADSALSSVGYAPYGSQTFTVLENTGSDMNLILPEIPAEWIGLDYIDLLERMNFQIRQVAI